MTLITFSSISSNGELVKSGQINMNNLRLIKIGDPYNKVIEVLGVPSSDDLMRKKRNNEIQGRRLMYIVKQADPDSFNAEKDRYLRLWFDPNDKLVELTGTVAHKHCFE